MTKPIYAPGLTSATDPVSGQPLLNPKSAKLLQTSIDPSYLSVGRRTTEAGAWVPVDDQPLHVATGSPLDFSALRATAVPAGSRGRITVSGDNLLENGVAVKFNVATWAPNNGFDWIPSSKADITAAAEHLSKVGYNVIRIHGFENLLMSGQDGEWNLNTSLLDNIDFFLSELKRVGIYWVFNPMSWWLGKDMDGATDRFSPSHSDGGYKTRIYTHQNIRDHWVAGMNAIYNRVNPYTGVNLLQDPALVMVELFNESETIYVGNQAGNNGFPAVWLTRDSGATAAAKTWSEWLADPVQLHGYADVAALNTSWGTAHADLAAAGAAAIGSNSISSSPPSTAQALDAQMYVTYLEDHLSAFYVSAMATLSPNCIMSQTTATSSALITVRGIASLPANMVSNTHGYPFLANSGNASGASLTKGVTPVNFAIWDPLNRSALAPSLWQFGGKPNWFGEYGYPAWGKYRAQMAVWAAAMIQNNASGVSSFHQGRFWEPSYKLLSDATTAQRFGVVYPYYGHGDPVAHFSSTLISLLQNGNILTRQSSKTDYSINQKAFGWSKVGGTMTRVTGRSGRGTGGLNRPMMYVSMINRINMNYDPDINSTDDTYASVNLARSWKQFLGDFTPVKTVSAVMTSGSYGGYTASATQPIITLGTPLYQNTVTGDKLFFTNMAGSTGSWPGTTQATVACPITVIDSQHVQVTSGLNLTGLSGFTAGTYTEAAEHFQSMNVNNGNIVSVTTTGTVLGATASPTQPIFVLGANGGSTGNTTLVTGDEVFITNLTGTGGTGGAWPGTGSRAATMTATVLDQQTVQITSGWTPALPSGLSAVAPTAGTWCEGLNVVEGRFREWGISNRLQRAWINTPRAVALFSGPSTTYPLTIGSVTFSALTADASMFVVGLDGLPIASSKKILIGLVSDAQNSGSKFTDATRKTSAGGGVYPIQLADSYGKIRIERTAFGRPTLTPLGISGDRVGPALKLPVDGTGIFAEMQNTQGRVIFWLLEV